MYKLYAKERNKQDYDYIKSFEEENKIYSEVDNLDTSKYKEAIILQDGKYVYYKEFMRCDKCKIELSEVFIQETPQRTYRLCKNCNNYYMKLMGNVKKLEKRIDNERFKNKK